MLKAIFHSVMKRIDAQEQWPASLDQSIEPRIMKKMEKRIEKARFWEASRAGGWYYSVTHGSNAFIVKLTKRSCSCKSWELSNLPYSHAIVVMREERLNPMTFVHDCYSTKSPTRIL